MWKTVGCCGILLESETEHIQCAASSCFQLRLKRLSIVESGFLQQEFTLVITQGKSQELGISLFNFLSVFFSSIFPSFFCHNVSKIGHIFVQLSFFHFPSSSVHVAFLPLFCLTTRKTLLTQDVEVFANVACKNGKYCFPLECSHNLQATSKDLQANSASCVNWAFRYLFNFFFSFCLYLPFQMSLSFSFIRYLFGECSWSSS